MRYKTLFRVLQKVIGVFLVATAIGEFLMATGMAVYYVDIFSMGMGGPGSATFIMAAAQVIAPLVKFALGLYLFFGAKWIANLAIPGNRAYCHECGYDLNNAPGPECPECGTSFGPSIKGYGTIEPPPRIVDQDD